MIFRFGNMLVSSGNRIISNLKSYCLDGNKHSHSYFAISTEIKKNVLVIEKFTRVTSFWGANCLIMICIIRYDIYSTVH